MLTKDPQGPWGRYRDRQTGRTVYAKQMPDDFRIETEGGTVDQRKAGAKHIRKYVYVVTGRAGDYLVIYDLDTGQRSQCPGRAFPLLFEPLDDG